MPRPINHHVPRKNSTEEKLRATPFEQVSDLDAEEKTIRLGVWRRLTETRILEELRTKPEFKHIEEEIKAGLICSVNITNKDQLYKIFSDGLGLKMEINKDFRGGLGAREELLYKTAIQAGLDSYLAMYMEIKGLAQRSVPIEQMDLKEKTKK